MSVPHHFPPAPQPPVVRRRKWLWVAGAVVTGVLVVGGFDPTGSHQDTAGTAEPVASADASAASTGVAVASPVPPAVIAAPERVLSVAPVSLPLDYTADADTALATLQSLRVKGRAPKTGYARHLFGQAWTDDVTVDGGHNGCDTRNDVLRRDLTNVVLKPGSNGCAVQSGTLDDPYSGKSIVFVRGSGTSSAVQIDHIVALSDAWQKGAQQLDSATLRNLANDPRNLQATDGPTNQQKGDGDAATWLPANKPYRCTYVTRQVDVKAAYGLWVTQAEHDAISRVLSDCGATTPLHETTTESVTVAPSTTEYVPAPTYSPQPAYTPPPASAPLVEVPSDRYYANCAAVRAAGAAPLYAGQPGYRSKLDGDRDGVACE